MINPTPYADLKPHVILDAVESSGFKCNGNLLALNSFENRVYQVGIENASPLIAKFYRPNRWSNQAIIEEHQFAAELAEYEIPVVAPLIINNQTLHTFNNFCFAVFERKSGRALELDNLDQLEWMGRFIGRLHALGATRSFQHRIKLNVQTYGYIPYKFLLQNNFIPEEIKTEYCHIVEMLLQKITERFQHVGAINCIRLHGDCHAGNILWNETGPHIVDLDDCLMGPAIQDIWMLINGDNEHDFNIQLNRILRGYREFHDFDYREVHLIEALRSLRMIHYSGWLAKRWEDPAFPLNFPWFNTLSYWKEQLLNLNEQLALLDKEIFIGE